MEPISYGSLKTSTTEDKIRIIVAFLAALKILFASFGLLFFDSEQLQAIENVLPFLFIAWGIWKNNYLTSKGKQQKKVLKDKKLL